MTLYHFGNCLALVYAPYHMAYKFSGISEYATFSKCVYAGALYIFTQLCKMLLLATFFPDSDNIQSGGDYDVFLEILKATVDLADLLGIYIALNSIPGKGHAKILTAAIGWASAEFQIPSPSRRSLLEDAVAHALGLGAWALLALRAAHALGVGLAALAMYAALVQQIATSLLEDAVAHALGLGAWALLALRAAHALGVGLAALAMYAALVQQIATPESSSDLHILTNVDREVNRQMDSIRRIHTSRTNWTPKNSSKICSKHFHKNMVIKKNKLTVLYPNAVPTLVSE
ncbi:jg22826 [Pararge aegeria aegeria]|uniref:BOS complex subunit TMEM147 n=1 Tax=Pararge aegeria aegeria TaxID=348720 RepID=A0A8S4RYD5_9NEOP|nr:jg22826 [Pararge aegeria aegeria]